MTVTDRRWQHSAATVLLTDLDDFREVRDPQGHSAGDTVLKAVTARTVATFTGAPMAARLSGEEFVALLPGNDERMARAVTARLVAKIAATHEFAGTETRLRAERL